FSADNVGNVEQVKSATVLIDATPPACPGCSAADYLRGTVTLSASPADTGAGIKSVAFQYADAGGAIWTTIGTDTTGPAPYTADWDTTAVPDGHYDLQIVVTDNANNTTTTTLADKVGDTTAPTVAPLDAPGQYRRGNVTLTASSDPDTVSADFQRSPAGANTWTTISTDMSGPFSAALDTTTLADGLYDFRVVATDGIGNTGTSAVRADRRVDNTSPTGSLPAPASGA